MRLVSKLNLNRGNDIPVKFIIEDADWAIKTVGQSIKNEIDIFNPKQIELITKLIKLLEALYILGRNIYVA